ncbi:phage tail tape measure protein [Paeniglutamicibacter sp. NPDC091659]|uniref:phage tail tape measure protein n=1 Tax=Paeniglutamicibacter sp. NPDC091659 TaxID=3364389 RepID=UPI0038139BDB
MASNKINIVISATDKASKPIRDVKDELEGGAKSSSKFGSAFSAVAPIAIKTGLALGAASTAASIFAVKSAADYEQSLNIFQSVSEATVDQMKMVAATSRDLGNDLSLPGVSAADAALAMVELAKAGLSVNDTLAASKGVLSLAKAGQLETGAAAEIAANALNAFNLEGKEASRVADLLAAAANASSADVGDLAFSLSMSSASAAAVKVPVEDLTAAIAEMANNGIKGSDAGTSLKTMFMNLIPTTKKARASFDELNLDFYNSKGTFVGLRDMIKQLEEGTKDLTDEQKAMHIEQIFGSDSSRAVNILLKEGVKGYDAMSVAVEKQGAATKLAAAQNAGFKGALDGLQSALETVAIDVGMKMLPSLTDIVTTLSDNVEPAFERASSVIGSVGSQVVTFLQPAFSGLADAVVNRLLPAFADVAKSDIVRMIGQTLVGALYAAIRVTEAGVRVFSSIASQASHATGFLVILGAGFITYKGYVASATLITKANTLALSANVGAQNALKMAVLTNGRGFVGYQSVLMATTSRTTAAMVAQQALNRVMMLNPFALVTAAVVGITGAYISAVSQTDRSAASTERLKAAQEGLTQAQREAKQAQDDLTGANLSLEGAQLRVEGAQNRVKDALINYGPQSLEYRQAVLDEKLAEEDLKRAKQAVADATDKKAKANQKVIDQEKEVKESSKRVGDAVQKETAKWSLLGDTIGQAREKAGGRANSKSGGDNIKLPSNPFSFGKSLTGYASGTNASSGGRFRVGEHGVEEVSLPAGSRVTPAYRTRSESGGGQSSGHTVIIENMNINNGGDRHRLLSDIGFALETAS